MIVRVLAPNPGPMTGTGTNTYVVDDGQRRLAVIDPGPDDPRHVEAIFAAAEPLGTIVSVLVTHRHLDHLPAAGPVCERSGAHLVGHADLPGVQQVVADGEMAFGSLVALETPGHTRESLCFWEPDAGNLFTGDLVAGAGTVVVDDQPGALAQYLASIERLLALRPSRLYPGHGPLVDNAIGKLQEYLDHRRQRIQQVTDVLHSRGPCSVDQLVSAIYTDVPSNLVPMAARNVRANLDLLATRGEVQPPDADGDWRLAQS